MQARVAGQRSLLVGAGLEAVGAGEPDDVGHARGDAGPQGVRGGVDGVAGHDAVRRQLAARDHHQSRHRGDDGVLAGDPAGRLGLAGGEWPQAGVDALDVLVAQGFAQHRVHVPEQVVDVGAGRRRVCLVEVPGRVGGADDPVPAPGDHEQHGGLGAHDQSGLEADPVTGYDEVDPLAGLDAERPAAAHELLDVVGPDAGGVDHHPGADGDLAAGLEVDGAGTGDPLALAQEADHLGAGREVRAVPGRGACDGRHQPRVVDLGVVVADGTGQRVGSQVGGQPQGAAPGEVPVPGQTHVVLPGHRHRVVERQTRSDVRPLPAEVGQRVEERHRPDEVRRQPGQQQAALRQRLADQPEVEHLQVAQPAVDQLAGPRRRAGREVALLHQAGREAAGDRVQRGAGADHSPTDDEHVELLRVESSEGRRTSGRGQRGHGVRTIRVRVPSESSRSRAIGWSCCVRCTTSRSRSCTASAGDSAPTRATGRPSGS